MRASPMAAFLLVVAFTALNCGHTAKDVSTPEETDMKEHTVVPEAEEGQRGIRLEKLSQPPLNTTMMGVLKGVSDYHGLDLDDPLVFGLSGHAFLINIHVELCPSGPYVWKRETMDPLIENMGMKMTDLGFFSPMSPLEDKRRVGKQMRDALDAAIPCSLINMENQIIDGYDETGFFTAQPWAPHNLFPPGRLTFDTWEEFGDEYHVNFYTIEKVKPIGRKDAIIASLDYAIDMHRNPGKYSTEAYGVGPKAYDNWISAVPLSGSSHGNWWNAIVWSESRFMAAEYFVEIGREHKVVSGLCLQLKNRHLNISENLKKVSSKEMAPEEKIEMLKETKSWEADAAGDVETLVAALRAEPGDRTDVLQGVSANPVMMDKGEVRFLGMATQEEEEGSIELAVDHVIFQLFFPNIAKFEIHREGEGLYGIPYEGYRFGLPAKKMTGVPEDLPEGSVYMEAPAQRYAVFITTPGALGNEANEMVRSWLASQTDYTRNEDAFEIEYYPPTSRGAEEPIELWIPVAEADRE